ncbi:MAG TPA: energy transducer TonB [Anaeromyxobacteraceae bacterium]|nr:energy transducer TonB [Anaeromyxobacteraceae bacterium]
MFDRIVHVAGVGARAARRVPWTAGAAAAQGALVATIIVVGAAPLAAPEPELPTVEVRILAPPLAPRAPAAVVPASVAAAVRRIAAARPGVRMVKPPPPSALIQPREVAAEMRMPAPDEPIEAIDVDAIAGDGDEGVIGGWAAPVPEEPRRAGDEIEEAPQYATAGFRRPAELEPGCIARAIRLPPELAGFVSGPITVRFAVGRDGRVGRIELLTPAPDRRIEVAIQRALQGCGWRPGTDPRGVPLALWVVMPIRFESG